MSAHYHACEWCDQTATYRLSFRGYRRYACIDVMHRAKLWKLARLDGYTNDDMTHVNGGPYFVIESGDPECPT